MAWDLFDQLVTGALDGLTSGGDLGWKRATSQPAEPTIFQMLGMMYGAAAVFGGCVGLCVYLHQWQQLTYIQTHPPAQALIVSIDRTRAQAAHSTDVLINYQRQTPAGPVECDRAQARFENHLRDSRDFDVGKTVEVYPQSGSCYRPIYAPDVGHPLTTLLVSIIALLTGAAVFNAGYTSLQRRRRMA